VHAARHCVGRTIPLTYGHGTTFHDMGPRTRRAAQCSRFHEPGARIVRIRPIPDR
jgi:hypothetical protein